MSHALPRQKTFVVTEEHIKLLKRTYVSWWDAEYGAPGIDPKRPYGNSDVEGDIAEILAEFPDNAGDETTEPSYTEAQLTRYRQLHQETQHALEIFLRTGKMEPGTYVAGAYDANWVKLA